MLQVKYAFIPMLQVVWLFKGTACCFSKTRDSFWRISDEKKLSSEPGVQMSTKGVFWVFDNFSIWNLTFLEEMWTLSTKETDSRQYALWHVWSVYIWLFSFLHQDWWNVNGWKGVWQSWGCRSIYILGSDCCVMFTTKQLSFDWRWTLTGLPQVWTRATDKYSGLRLNWISHLRVYSMKSWCDLWLSHPFVTMAKSSTDTVTYFVAKCISMDSLKRSARNSIWACCDRKTPPQPRDLLTQGGDVILLFSVNNCHGWHGYAQVSSPPGSVTEEEFNATLQPNETLTLTKDKSKDGDPVWHRFRIEWKILYLKEHGEQCLPFTETEELVCCDGQPVNKARNFQEVSPETGEIMCQKMDLHLAYLTSTRQKKLEERQQKLPPPFFQPGTENDPKRVWDKLVHKVSNMGKVLLACAFGSQRYTCVHTQSSFCHHMLQVFLVPFFQIFQQPNDIFVCLYFRYNLHTPESDVDMFVVYAADTKDFLGFSPPQHTIKVRVRNTEFQQVKDERLWHTRRLVTHPSCNFRTLSACSSVVDFASWCQKTEMFQFAKKKAHQVASQRIRCVVACRQGSHQCKVCVCGAFPGEKFVLTEYIGESCLSSSPRLWPPVGPCNRRGQHGVLRVQKLNFHLCTFQSQFKRMRSTAVSLRGGHPS